ncbi:6-phosphogluconate dehydrogenase C-terminal domain-like protein [Patellaria atrata CBS 101060]|uniref:6-phosphogluconate dehydrogenase C-terminal domain-like protein n=1 Tax=Patellaria atrata CBS 101060 TaxID=1346257 RepID=A0A9P4VMS4_9PEZI|nr:6-phosphogluconate dehydrogenase C-terminal domain-like protein [Patellaria atrata CBS 101060]
MSSIKQDERIHILGTGALGKFLAFNLREGQDLPRISLLFHSRKEYKRWEHASGGKVILKTDGVELERSGFDIEWAIPIPRRHGQEIGFNSNTSTPMDNGSRGGSFDFPLGIPTVDTSSIDGTSNDPIRYLIVTTQASHVMSSIGAIRHRITPETSILFFQKAMGFLDEINKEYFPDPATRPNYLVGSCSHVVSSANSFTVVHETHGTIFVGLPVWQAPKTIYSSSSKSHKELLGQLPQPSLALMRSLTRIPLLSATPMGPTDLFQLQLEKLAVNAIIGPITVLCDVRNGSLLYNFRITRVFRLLISEISLVIRSLPELQGLPNLHTRFAPERLENIVVGNLGKTAGQVSVMLKEAREGGRREIQYVTGYFVKRGEEVGVKCFMNYLIMQLVMGKMTMIEQEMEGFIPFAGLVKGGK